MLYFYKYIYNEDQFWKLKDMKNSRNIIYFKRYVKIKSLD